MTTRSAVVRLLLLAASLSLCTIRHGQCLLVPQHQQRPPSLLSDLPTPSLVLDVRALRKNLPTATSPGDLGLPHLRLSNKKRTGGGIVLSPTFATKKPNADSSQPQPEEEEEGDDDDEMPASTVVDVNSLQHTPGESAIVYLHSSVIRDGKTERDDDPCFIVELDLKPNLLPLKPHHQHNSPSKEPPAQLVLGLNNHHTISYYWARSAGTGASMDAPGIVYTTLDHHKQKQQQRMERGALLWESIDYKECNSNDGKRSEWAKFLKVGDQVQLLPRNDMMEDVFMEFASRKRVYGVTLEGRPLGSEPTVVCQWKIAE